MINLSNVSSSYQNNFNLIRMLAALGVFISHCFYLSGYTSGGKPALLGYISLNIFFFISGFFVSKSYFQRDTIYYFKSRFLRIFPALICAVLFSAVIIGSSFTNLSIKEYIFSLNIYVYIIKNIALLLPNIPQTLPGVFTEINQTDIVNAPLWSLPYEIICYISLPILALLTMAKSYRWIFLVAVLLLFIFMYSIFVYNFVNHTEVIPQLLGKDVYRLYSLFLLGILTYLFKDYIFLSWKLILMFILIIGLASLLSTRLLLVGVSFIMINYCILYFAYIPKKVISRYNKLGDYSYGVYIFGYPIQQSIEHLSPNLSLLTFTLLSLPITFIIAVLSWHLVERKFLALK